MALASAQVPVTGTAVNLLASFTNMGTVTDIYPAIIENLSSSVTVYIGGPGVTTSNGFPLFPQVALPFQLLYSDTPYAVCSGSATVAVLVGRQ